MRWWRPRFSNTRPKTCLLAVEEDFVILSATLQNISDVPPSSTRRETKRFESDTKKRRIATVNIFGRRMMIMIRRSRR